MLFKMSIKNTPSSLNYPLMTLNFSLVQTGSALAIFIYGSPHLCLVTHCAEVAANLCGKLAENDSLSALRLKEDSPQRQIHLYELDFNAHKVLLAQSEGCKSRNKIHSYSTLSVLYEWITDRQLVVIGL